jgi:hypothetical protein
VDDNIQINAGSGPAVKTDNVAGEHFQVVKLADGTSESSTPIAAGEGVKERALRVVLPTDAGDVKVTLDSEAVDLGATDTGHLAAIETAVELIDDAISGTEMQVDVVGALPAGDANIGNVDIVTVPAPLNVVGGGAEATALRVTLANDSTGVVSVDDGGGAITVDGTVTAELSATDNAVLDAIAAAVATEGDALGDGVLIQGDDGTDRTNVLVDADGHLQVDVLSGGGGGTQYTEGDTDATITGTAMLMEGVGDALVVVPGTAADGVLVNLGANNDVAVSGTVTAELSAADNAVLDAIQTAVEKLDDAVAGSELQVDVVASALPTGAATAAKQDTIIGHVDGIETVLGTIDADTSALAGCVGGSEMQVDVVGALPAGSNAIGKLAANSGVDIGDVDVTSVVPGVAATSLGKAEDAAHSSGDTGVQVLAVRKDTAAALAGSDGDYAPLEVDSAGKLHVNVGAVTPGSAASNLGKAEDAAHSSGDVGVMMLAVRDDTIGVFSGAEGDYEPLHTDANGRLYVNSQGAVAHDAAAAGNPVQIAGEARSTERAAVASADAARLVTDLVGKLITLPYANPELFVKGKTAAITDTTRTAVIAAQGAGVKLYITHIAVTNGDTETGTYVKIEDGTTEIYGGWAAANGGGFSYTLPVPLVLTANTALNVTCGTTGATVYASASGYKGA